MTTEGLTMDDPEIRDALNDIEALLDPERAEAVCIIYPRNAAALNLDPAGLLLSAAVTLTCDGCGQTVPFNGSRIEGYFDDAGELWTQAEWSRQHGCGTWAPEIVTATWNAAMPAAPEVVVAALRDAVKAARMERDAATIRRLQRELAEFVAQPIEDREDTGSDIEPGIYHTGRQWLAWDYTAGSTGDSWDTIDVTEDDLTIEAGQ